MGSLRISKESIRNNLNLSIPLIIGQLGQVLVMVSDNIMVGQLGAVELAAVSLGVAIYAVFFVMGVGLSLALPPLIAEYFGKRNNNGINSSFKHSLIINAIYGIIVIVTGEILYPLLYHMGQEVSVVDSSIPYCRFSMISILPFMLFMTMRSLADGKGNTVIGMKALTIGNILNITLNYVFIFGKLGLPVMGVMGAGLSTLVANILMLFILTGFYLKSPDLRQHLFSLKKTGFSFSEVKNVLAIGVMTSLQMLFEVSIFTGSTFMMGKFGEISLAAHQIALNLITVSFMITTGFSLAATIEVGRNYGTKNMEEVRKSGYTAILMSCAFMIIAGLIFVAFRYILPRIYISNLTVIETAASFLIFAALFQIPDGIQISAIGASRGLQDVKIPALVTFFSYIVVGLPVSYVLAFILGLGANGVWVGLLVGLSLSAALNAWRFNYTTSSIRIVQ